MSTSNEAYQKDIDQLEADLLEQRLAGLSDEEKEVFMAEYREAKGKDKNGYE